MHRRQRKSESRRWALWLGAVAGAAVSGLVELVALQRARYQLWRERLHDPSHR